MTLSSLTRLKLRYKIAIIYIIIATFGGIKECRRAYGEEYGICSWYSTKESKGVMANGQKFIDNDFTCASWNYPFETSLKVTAIFAQGKDSKEHREIRERGKENSKTIRVVVTDRGPSQPKCSCLKEPQRIIDLSKASFEKLAPLSCGLIAVKIEVVKGD